MLAEASYTSSLAAQVLSCVHVIHAHLINVSNWQYINLVVVRFVCPCYVDSGVKEQEGGGEGSTGHLAQDEFHDSDSDSDSVFDIASDSDSESLDTDEVCPLTSSA